MTRTQAAADLLAALRNHGVVLSIHHGTVCVSCPDPDIRRVEAASAFHDACRPQIRDLQAELWALLFAECKQAKPGTAEAPPETWATPTASESGTDKRGHWSVETVRKAEAWATPTAMVTGPTMARTGRDFVSQPLPVQVSTAQTWATPTASDAKEFCPHPDAKFSGLPLYRQTQITEMGDQP